MPFLLNNKASKESSFPGPLEEAPELSIAISVRLKNRPPAAIVLLDGSAGYGVLERDSETRTEKGKSASPKVDTEWPETFMNESKHMMEEEHSSLDDIKI